MEVILHEGECWFRGADVTRWLRYQNGRQVILQWVKPKDKTTKEFLTAGGDRSIYINENGMRALARRSRRPEADDLEVWVATDLDAVKASFSRCQVKSLIVQLAPGLSGQGESPPRLSVHHGEPPPPRARQDWTERLPRSQSQTTLCWTTVPDCGEALLRHQRLSRKDRSPEARALPSHRGARHGVVQDFREAGHLHSRGDHP